jgi:hypothetical protein
MNVTTQVEPEPDLAANAPSASPPAGDFAPEAFRITRCLRCNYPLDGLPRGGTCPECGTAVASSLRGAELAFANRDHLAILGRGLWIACPGALLLYAVLTLHSVLEIFKAIPYNRAYEVAWIGLCTVAILSVLVGLWLFTTPDPTAPKSGPQEQARRYARISMFVVCTAVLLQIVCYVSWREFIGLASAAVQTDLSIAWPVVMGGLGSVTTLSQALTIWSVMRYTRAMGHRIPDARMVLGCTLYQWLLPTVALSGLSWLVLTANTEPQLIAELFTVGALAVAVSFPRRLQSHIRSILRSGVPADLRGMGRLPGR